MKGHFKSKKCSRKHTAAVPATNCLGDQKPLCRHKFLQSGLLLPAVCTEMFFHYFYNVYCFIKNMQTSLGNDFEVINIFNTLTLEALSSCKVNDAWRPFNIFGVLIKWRKTKSLATSNLGIMKASTPTIYYCIFIPLACGSHISHTKKRNCFAGCSADHNKLRTLFV